jgi:hypothetical protein
MKRYRKQEDFMLQAQIEEEPAIMCSASIKDQHGGPEYIVVFRLCSVSERKI